MLQERIHELMRHLLQLLLKNLAYFAQFFHKGLPPLETLR